jgi:hypothetical protein
LTFPQWTSTVEEMLRTGHNNAIPTKYKCKENTKNAG